MYKNRVGDPSRVLTCDTLATLNGGDVSRIGGCRLTKKKTKILYLELNPSASWP